MWDSFHIQVITPVVIMGKNNVWVEKMFLLKAWLGNLEGRGCLLSVTPLKLERMCPSQGGQAARAQGCETRGIWVLGKVLQVPWAGFVEVALCWRSATSLSMALWTVSLCIAQSTWKGTKWKKGRKAQWNFSSGAFVQGQRKQTNSKQVVVIFFIVLFYNEELMVLKVPRLLLKLP